MTELFFDSGAHSLYTLEVLKKQKTMKDKDIDYYRSKDFWKYVDDYCDFVKSHKHIISEFVNVDVIFNPELTWKVQKYIEKKHKLFPIPVVHYGATLEYLKKYIAEGYVYIGIGGLGQEVNRNMYFAFANKVFDIICDTKDRMPKVKTHGFAVTSFAIMRKYPWYSVDSTSWLKLGNYGKVFIPRRKHNEWDYTQNPIMISISTDESNSERQGILGQHFLTISKKEQEVFLKYFKEKGFTFEELASNWEKRALLNQEYFVDFNKSLPDWPWPFVLERKGFGL